ncbi:MAG: hypothetical protein ACXWC6_02950 [Ramlibacter sp.]
MDMESLFARAVGIVAEIHHSHGIKAALAVRHLRHRFPQWSDGFWDAIAFHNGPMASGTPRSRAPAGSMHPPSTSRP